MNTSSVRFTVYDLWVCVSQLGSLLVCTCICLDAGTLSVYHRLAIFVCREGPSFTFVALVVNCVFVDGKMSVAVWGSFLLILAYLCWVVFYGCEVFLCFFLVVDWLKLAGLFL